MDMVPQNINNQYNLTNGTKFMLGNVWPPKHVLWPDFTDNVTRDWFESEFVRFHQVKNKKNQNQNPNLANWIRWNLVGHE